MLVNYTCKCGLPLMQCIPIKFVSKVTGKVCVCVCVCPPFSPLLRFLLCTTKLINNRLYVIKHDVDWSGMIYSRAGSFDFNLFHFILFSAA